MSYASEQAEHHARKQEIEMTKELKPCPFCGGEAKVENFEPWESLYWVGCKKCGSTGERSKSLAGAINAWNRRVSDES